MAAGTPTCTSSGSRTGAGGEEFVYYDNLGGSDELLYLRVDSANNALFGTFDLNVEVVPFPEGETCAQAHVLTDGVVVTSPNLGMVQNDYGSSGTGCATFYSGPDLVYRVDLPPLTRAAVTVTPAPGSGINTSISLSTSEATCHSLTCVANTSATTGTDVDRIQWDNATTDVAPLYIRVDTISSSSVGTFDVVVDFSPLGGGGSCDVPMTLVANDPPLVSQTLADGATPAPVCGLPTGRAVYYSVDVPANQMVNVFVRPDNFNANVRAISTCPAADCVEAADAVSPSSGNAGVEGLTLHNQSTAAATYFVMAGSPNGTTAGTFSIEARHAVDGEICARPEILNASPGVPHTTDGYVHNIGTSNIAANNCLASSVGADRVYQVTLQAGEVMTATVTPTTQWSPNIYLLPDATACLLSGTTCLAGDNSGGTGEPDSLTYKNTSTLDQTYLFVVDGTAAGQWGEYTLDVQFVTPVCGNGTLEAFEVCDDGNTNNADGCTSQCQVEPGYGCAGVPSHCVVRATAPATCDGSATTLSAAACSVNATVLNYFPTCGAGQLQYVFSSGPPQTTPLTTTPFSSPITVPNLPGIVARAALRFDIATENASDIDLTLTGPAGTPLDLTSDNGGAGDHYAHTVLDSDCQLSVTDGVAPFSGCYAPETSLEGLIGLSPGGVWELQVADDLATLYPSTFHDWSLILCVTP